MEGFGQFRVIIQTLLKFLRHIKLRHAPHLHLGAGFLNRNGLLYVGLNRRLLLVDVRKRSKPDLPRGLHIPGLLNEDALGVFKQSAFHEKQSAIILKAMDQNHVSTTQIVASLAPFQFFVEARSKAQLAKRGIFGTPALFLAMYLTYEWIHSCFDSIWIVSGRIVWQSSCRRLRRATRAQGHERRLKYWTARSCFSAAARVSNVPRFRRRFVRGSILREYSRYLPELSLRIMRPSLTTTTPDLASTASFEPMTWSSCVGQRRVPPKRHDILRDRTAAEKNRGAVWLNRPFVQLT